MKNVSAAHWITLLIFSLLAPLAWASPSYVLTNLGVTLPTSAGSVAKAINNQGQIVISSAENTGPAAYLWDGGFVSKIGSASSTFNVTDINELGQVVGTGGFFGIGVRAYRWDQTTGLTFLNPLGGYAGSRESVASGVNNLGHVAGRTTGVYEPYGASWWNSSGSIQALDRWGTLSEAEDINDAGTIVGSRDVWSNSNKYKEGFVWNANSGFVEIGTLGGNESYAVSLNENGSVVGGAKNSDGVSKPFFWTSTDGMRELITPSYVIGAQARSLNNNDNVVGDISTSGGETHAAFWNGSDFFDLNDLVDLDEGWTLTNAWDINDKGQIVGQVSNGMTGYAFLLTPVSQVPEPAQHSLYLTGVGMLILLRSKRFRNSLKTSHG